MTYLRKALRELGPNEIWLRDAALAELSALEAVAEAARRIRSSGAACSCRYMGDGDVIECWPCIERKRHRELTAALARLAAVQDGQPSANTAIPTTAGIEPAAELACPCRVHGDPDGDCGEECG